MDAWQIMDWVSAEIERRGWTPIMAAEKLGISVSCVRYMKKKQGALRLDSLTMILDTMGYELAIVKKESNK